MEVTRKSLETSQPWSFWIIYLVTHMIRSGLSIYLSIDLLLVALIISTGFSESHVARRLQQDHRGPGIEIPQQIWRFRAL